MSAPLRVVILGATSGIARAAAREWAGRGAALTLVGRDPARLHGLAQDLIVRGANSASPIVCELASVEAHPWLLSQLEAGGRMDQVLLAWGTLPDQSQLEGDAALVARALDINATSVIALASALAERLAEQRHGTMGVIGSVAGDRGRRANYVYGAAKAAIDTFMSGLRGRMQGTGAAVILIKPGLVRTTMTAHVKPSPLMADADQVGRDIVRALDRPSSQVVYVPFYWRYIMAIVRCLPESIVHRLKA